MKRYDLSIEVKGGEMRGAEMLKNPRGAYVLYADHWSEVDRLQSELDKLVETGECAGCPENKRLEREVKRLEETIEILTEEHNAQAVCAEEFAFLRGENARLELSGGTMVKVLEYVLFVMTGSNEIKADLCNDVQMAVDRIKEKLENANTEK